MSELVVDGRCLVAFLVTKGEGIGMVFLRSGSELLQAEIVEGGVFCLLPKVLRSSLLKHTFCFGQSAELLPKACLRLFNFLRIRKTIRLLNYLWYSPQC